ncbi:Gfo/Idh/MocA family protein [Gimesia aquarii]|uniref:Putative oxidoreductase YdgJ n=1 Tax=Gimesia aquarii TaxID=2527964 RepID=A0A517X2S9_9PLAN|nr:Gfo/Idh/MocA family oxidoreductase [Gimesia aquarii]QDU11823.1 putative oxidoreductase YdgJ [Gimesia aquarii]
MSSKTQENKLKAGLVGFGMIVDETYRPFFETVHETGLYQRNTGPIEISLEAVATRTGARAEKYLAERGEKVGGFQSFSGNNAIEQMVASGLDFACVASPDDRHFDSCKKVLESETHLIVEKPSVLKLQELDELTALAEENNVAAKIVYHKLLDPDHKKLRTLVHDDVLQHVNNGYCSLLEPKSISGSQFAQWITGRNPGTYVAVHYIKLIDFTFGGKLKTITASGQRGLVGEKYGPTWDSCQMRMVYEYDSGREAAFDIHTSWVTPDNFPGYVEQEVQFRFDNGLWNGHSRKRGVECTVEEKTPFTLKNSMNNHYNGTFVEPWGTCSQRGYGIEVIERFAREVAFIEHGGPSAERQQRLEEVRGLSYNDLSADRQTVAAVQALEAILEKHVQGEPDCVVRVNDKRGGLVLFSPGSSEAEVLYEGTV